MGQDDTIPPIKNGVQIKLNQIEHNQEHIVSIDEELMRYLIQILLRMGRY